MNVLTQITRASVLVASLLCLSNLHALESDLQQPINVQADKSEYDEKAGTQTLSGNVEISQGSMRIKAEEIAISLTNNALHTISGTGAPIQFQQENESGDLMKGEAESIIYDAIAGTLTLKGAATLSQPRQNLVSDLIIFDARSQKVNAEGGGKTGRVSIQLLPPTNTGTQ